MAQYSLGDCYYYGWGVAEDEEEAVKWYRKAAEQGYAGAQNDLGLCYKNGYGVEKNAAKAVEWYRKAAEQGEMHAQYNLGGCYGNGIGGLGSAVAAGAALAGVGLLWKILNS